MSRLLLLFLPLLISALCLALPGLGAAPASAAVHGLDGNARFQVGQGLPRPWRPGILVPGTTGPVEAVAGATVQVTTVAGSPARLVLKPDQLTVTASPQTVPIFLANSGVFQLFTSVAAQFPASTVSFEAGGRTGAATLTHCPGRATTTITVGNCPLSGPVPSSLVRYTRTAAQFGGPAPAHFQGPASVGLRVAASAPCSGSLSCQVIFADNTGPGVFGDAFGVTGLTSNPGPSPGRFIASVTFAGLVANVLTPQGLGAPNDIQSFAGPWTTGRVTVSVPSASPPALVVFSGSDGRSPGGQGTISLVSGGVTASTIGGPALARGWLNLTVLPEPTAWTGAAAGALALLGLARLRRARHPAGQAE